MNLFAPWTLYKEESVRELKKVGEFITTITFIYYDWYQESNVLNDWIEFYRNKNTEEIFLGGKYRAYILFVKDCEIKEARHNFLESGDADYIIHRKKLL